MFAVWIHVVLNWNQLITNKSKRWFEFSALLFSSNNEQAKKKMPLVLANMAHAPHFPQPQDAPTRIHADGWSISWWDISSNEAFFLKKITLIFFQMLFLFKKKNRKNNLFTPLQLKKEKETFISSTKFFPPRKVFSKKMRYFFYKFWKCLWQLQFNIFTKNQQLSISI